MEPKFLKKAVTRSIIGKKYFNVSGLRNNIEQQTGVAIKSRSLYGVLFRLLKANIIFDAGRGWYSTLSGKFELDTSSTEKLTTDLLSNFPYLKFSVWSTQQLQPYAHHVMMKFTSFVYSDVDFLSSIAEYLEERGYIVFRNPTKSEVEKYFFRKEKTCVLRPSISEEPAGAYSAPLEKLLVDLFLEKDRMQIMDESEYERIFNNIIMFHRINMGKLLRYAERREVKDRLRRQVFDHERILL